MEEPQPSPDATRNKVHKADDTSRNLNTWQGKINCMDDERGTKSETPTMEGTEHKIRQPRAGDAEKSSLLCTILVKRSVEPDDTDVGKDQHYNHEEHERGCNSCPKLKILHGQVT